MPVKSVTFTMPGRLCLGSCNDRFSFFPVEIPATVLRTRPVTCILFRPYGGTACRMLLLLGRHLSCTKLPCSASLGAWTTLLPLPVARSPKHHSRHRDRRLASGLASNAFRRSAARTLVCTLPLLHFSHSRVAVVQPPAVSKIFNPADDCPLAVPPPHFDLLVHSRGCLVWSELPLRTHSSRSFSSGRIFRFAVFSRSSRLWAVLRSGCNPLALSRQFTLSRGVCQAPHSEMPPRSQRPRSHPIGSAFLTISGEVHLNPYGSPSGYGPGLSNLAKTPCIGLVFDVTLCSFHTTQRLSRLGS